MRKARMQRGWTQKEAGARLGVSQAYVALLEKGHRSLPARLCRRAVRLLNLSPVLLPPVPKKRSAVTNDELARDLGRLGYPGFAYMRGGWLRNPGQVLFDALALAQLDSRVAEALPWLLLKYPELDSDWLSKEARLSNLTNRVGFVVDLARRVAERNGETASPRFHALTRLSEALRRSRLDVEDTLGQQSLTEKERDWFRANRPEEAKYWHLLTNWRAEFLQFSSEFK